MTIPKKVYQTWETKEFGEEFQSVLDDQKSKNPDFRFVLFDANERVEFIQTHFGKRHVDVYNRLKPGAYKADFWRYCVLWIEGGFYMDIDMLSLSSFDSLVHYNFVAPIDLNRGPTNHNVANGFIGSTPRHPIIKDCIDRTIFAVENEGHLYCPTDFDICGPGVLGQSINRYLGRHEYSSLVGKEGVQKDTGVVLLKFDENEIIHNVEGAFLILNKNGSPQLKELYDKECQRLRSFVNFGGTEKFNHDRYALDPNIRRLPRYHRGREARFRLFKHCGISNCIRRGFRWEEHQHDLIDQYVDKDSVAVEVGSHIGTLTVKLSKCAKKVLAFEPVEETFRVLSENMELNGCDNVSLHRFGLSNKEGTTRIKWIHPNNPGGTGLEGIDEEIKQPDNNVGGPPIVSLQTLDSYQLDRLDYLKIDAEGYEKFVIEGAMETIRRHRPTIVMECFQEIGVNKGVIASDAFLKKRFSMLLDLGYTYKHLEFEDFLFYIEKE